MTDEEAVAALQRKEPKPSQLERLARPFPSRLIHENPSGGGSYVKHSVVTEKLLAVVGPFSFELVEVIRGAVEAKPAKADAKSARGRSGSPALIDAVVGVVCRLTVDVDGRTVRVEEVGDCEDPHNWPHDGARLKDAMSDSLKRGAMRLGVTLHLWSGAEFSLYDQLHSGAVEMGVADSTPATSPAPENNAEAPPSAAADVGASPPEPPTSAAPSYWSPGKASLEKATARCSALAAIGVNILKERNAAKLPVLQKLRDEVDWHDWQKLLDTLEKYADEEARLAGAAS